MPVDFEYSIKNSAHEKIAKSAINFIKKSISYSKGWVDEGMFTNKKYDPLEKMIMQNGITTIIIKDLNEEKKTNPDLSGSQVGAIDDVPGDPKTAIMYISFKESIPRDSSGLGGIMAIEEVMYHELAHAGLGHLGGEGGFAKEHEAMWFNNNTFRDEFNIPFRLSYPLHPLDVEKGIKIKSKECFPAGTPISLWDGTQKPIEDIQIGDQVLAFDDDGKAVPGRVDKLFTNTTQEFIRLTFSDRTGGDSLMDPRVKPRDDEEALGDGRGRIIWCEEWTNLCLHR